MDTISIGISIGGIDNSGIVSPVSIAAWAEEKVRPPRALSVCAQFPEFLGIWKFFCEFYCYTNLCET